MKKLLSLLILCIVSLFLTGSAYAYSITSLLNPDGVSKFTDDSQELHIDYNGNDLIDTGDFLLTSLSINKILDASTNIETVIGGVSAYEEITAFLAVKITSHSFFATNAQGVDLYTYTATGLSAADDTWISSNTTYNISSLLGTDFTRDYGTTVGTVFVDSSNNADNTTLANAFTTMTDGDQVLQLGLGTGFSVTAPWDLTQLTIGATSTGITNSSITPNLIITDQNWLNYEFEENVNGGGSFLTPIAGSGASILDQTFLNVDGKLVPEPATFTLFGLGLLSIAGISRRRARR